MPKRDKIKEDLAAKKVELQGTRSPGDAQAKASRDYNNSKNTPEKSARAVTAAKLVATTAAEKLQLAVDKFNADQKKVDKLKEEHLAATKRLHDEQAVAQNPASLCGALQGMLTSISARGTAAGTLPAQELTNIELINTQLATIAQALSGLQGRTEAAEQQ